MTIQLLNTPLAHVHPPHLQSRSEGMLLMCALGASWF